MHQALQDGKLTSEAAQRLAGKLIFLLSTMFVQLGKAALQPIYARSHASTQSSDWEQLNGPLHEVRLRALIGLIQAIKPRFIPRISQGSHTECHLDLLRCPSIAVGCAVLEVHHISLYFPFVDTLLGSIGAGALTILVSSGARSGRSRHHHGW